VDASRHPVALLLKHGNEMPDGHWLIQPYKGDVRHWTWAQAADEVGQMAAALRDLGLPEGASVAISGMNTAHYLMADYAITLAGYVSVGLYPKQSAAHVTHILTHSDAAAVFVGPMPDISEFVGAIPAGVKTIALPYDGIPECDTTWDALRAGRTPVREFTVPALDQPMTLVYTSGSTGDPKGVMITHGNIVFVAENLVAAFPPQGEERLFSYLPLAHVFERAAVGFASTLYPASVYFLEDQRTLAKELSAVAPTRFYGVPLVFSRMQAQVVKKLGADRLRLMTSIPIVRAMVRYLILHEIGLQNVRVCISGSAPLPVPILEWFEQALRFDILQGYGLSETTLYATACRPGANRLGSVGKALPNAELKLSEEGELLIRHGAIMAGYYKDPEKTAETMTADGFLKTGDRVKIDDDGYVWITGRVKEIFKTLKGKYVAPAPIEGAMRRNGALDQVCLIGAGLNQPILLATLNDEGRNADHDDLERSLIEDMNTVNETLEPHEKIGKIVIVKETWTIDNGLLTPTLKVKSHAVEAHYADLIAKEAQTRNPLSWEE
jgi:long-chain acyl-CoA synthetase